MAGADGVPPINGFDWPISISTTMIGTEITPLIIALQTSALIGSIVGRCPSPCRCRWRR